MKRISLLALACLALAGCSSMRKLGAATPYFHVTNAFTSNQGCTVMPFGNADICYDSTNSMAPYANSGGPNGSFAAASMGPHVVSSGGTIPTVGTGTVTAGGTDAVMEVTGATSPVTVTFGTAWTVKPQCVCSDETSGTTACKPVPNSNGQTVVVTTASTDSFAMFCFGSKP